MPNKVAESAWRWKLRWFSVLTFLSLRGEKTANSNSVGFVNLIFSIIHTKKRGTHSQSFNLHITGIFLSGFKMSAKQIDEKLNLLRGEEALPMDQVIALKR